MAVIGAGQVETRDGPDCGHGARMLFPQVAGCLQGPRLPHHPGLWRGADTVAPHLGAGNLVIRPDIDVRAVSAGEKGRQQGSGAGARYVRRDEEGGERQHRQGGMYVDELKRVLYNRLQLPRDVRYVPEGDP